DVDPRRVLRAGGRVLPARCARLRQAQARIVSLLETRGVSRAFGSLVAINDVSFAVEPGELRAGIGPNGAGKTTFFNLISGLFPPTTGSIFFDGKEITRLSANKRVSLGITRPFQITEIFPELTVSENLRIA